MDNDTKRFLIWLTGKDYSWKFEPRNGSGIKLVNFPPQIWSYCFHNPKGANSVWFHVSRGPNVIHRLMQRICLGIHWERK